MLLGDCKFQTQNRRNKECPQGRAGVKQERRQKEGAWEEDATE